jgi:hypothetical protein
VPDYSLTLRDEPGGCTRWVSCWLLTRALLPEERLPPDLDHVCIATMKETVRTWVFEQERVCESCGYPQTYWPYKFKQRALALVIRQWAMESPNKAFARRLARNASWRSLVAHLKEHAEQLVESGLLDWCLATILASRGFPATPPIVAHLRDVVTEAEVRALPARGVLCSTLVYADLSEPQAARFNDGNPDFWPSMPLEFMGESRAIDKQIAAIRSDTLKWLRSWKRLELTSPTEVARSSATAPRSLTLDPLREVDIDQLGIEAIVVDHARGMPLDEAIERQVDVLRERLRKRRSRAAKRGGQVPPLVHGWEREVRARLHALVLPRLQHRVTKCNRR